VLGSGLYAHGDGTLRAGYARRGMGEPENGVEDPDEWSIDVVFRQLCLDALKNLKVAAPLATDRASETLCDRDALVDGRASRQADAHHLRNELIQYRREPRPLEMQQFGGAGQADPGMDAGADRSGQQGVAVSRSPFSSALTMSRSGGISRSHRWSLASTGSHKLCLLRDRIVVFIAITSSMTTRFWLPRPASES
jgi:hypothetical protein